MDRADRLCFVVAGDNDARPFGRSTRAWMAALAEGAGLVPVETVADVAPGQGVIVAAASHGWDPYWLRDLKAHPATALAFNGLPVLAHVAVDQAADMVAAMNGGAPVGGIELIEGSGPRAGRGRTAPRRFRRFVMPLDHERTGTVERAAFAASSRLLTDIFSRTMLIGPSFHLTRRAAGLGVTPVAITLAGGGLAMAAVALFSAGQFALGLVVSLGAILFDVTDGQLARCTGQVTRLGAQLDATFDWVVMPLWAIGWARGLDAVGRPIEPVLELMVIAAIVSGHVAERVIALLFRRRHGLPMAAWRPIDSRFRLIGARRNPGLAILAASLALGRPGQGLEWLALWILLSLIFHWLRFAQANARADRGRRIVGWLP